MGIKLVDIANKEDMIEIRASGLTFFVTLHPLKVLQKDYTLYIFCNTFDLRVLQKVYISITLKNYMLQKIYTPVYFLQHFYKKTVAKNIQICCIPLDPCTFIQYIFDVETDKAENKISPPRYLVYTCIQGVYTYTAIKLTKNVIISDIFSTSKKGVYIFCNTLSNWHSSCELINYSYHKSWLTFFLVWYLVLIIEEKEKRYRRGGRMTVWYLVLIINEEGEKM